MKFKLFNHQWLNLNDIDKNVLTVDVIAHSCSNCCMFANQSMSFFSVADHSIGMARYFMKRNEYELAMHGLLMNASEPFVSEANANMSKETRAMKTLIDQAVRSKYKLDENNLGRLDYVERELIEKSIEIMFPPVAQVNMPLASEPGMSKKVFIEMFNHLHGMRTGVKKSDMTGAFIQ